MNIIKRLFVVQALNQFFDSDLFLGSSGIFEKNGKCKNLFIYSPNNEIVGISLGILLF